jgi:hypothetical protein
VERGQINRSQVNKQVDRQVRGYIETGGQLERKKKNKARRKKNR